MTVKLSGLYAGKGQQFTALVNSGINSKQAMTKLQVHIDRVDGDARFDLKNHGGNDRVLHHFPLEHYAFFKQQGLMTAERQAPALGENISTLGLLEQDVCIGDEVAIGEVLLQITLPRAPCYKTNLQFRQREFARTMQDTRRCGWLYRVLTPGTIQADDSLSIVKRHCDISVADALTLYFAENYDAQAYERLLSAPGLGADWQQNLHKRLATEQRENWQGRLYGSEQFYEGW
ncbi:molybdenum cofactor sulfurase [Shewanella mangrovi]|uniref:Molybdenum cofactor sulfurase n=1 Tax=Shewanella mangrovi TaxID=1515746 RepID=A0A094LNC5_9GAMM|nr:MOSC domain-containing protein [Shewanella mangrovi]KFZ36633.1 molybdenum cofactor sulfurase [Shewanella mangrovi]